MDDGDDGRGSDCGNDYLMTEVGGGGKSGGDDD